MNGKPHRGSSVLLLLIWSVVFVAVLSIRSTQRVRGECYPAMWPTFIAAAAVAAAASVALWGSYAPHGQQTLWVIVGGAYAVFLYSGAYVFLCGYIAG